MKGNKIMRLDSQAIFSDAQAIRGTVVSTNVVKLASTENGLTEIAFGAPVPFLIQVVEDFAGATALKVEVQTAATEDFADAKVLAIVEAAAAELKAGYKFPLVQFPKGNLGFARINYVPTGTPTAGAITAGIVDAIDNSYQDM
jgi:hypothetical protein